MTNNDIKIAVMFFSATGNCKRIAENIYSHFHKNAVLIDITHRINKKMDVPACDILFLVSPVYSQLCPAPIKKFFSNLQFKGAVVPCVSYGSVSAGKALKQIFSIFQKKGAIILAAAEFASSHSYLASSDPNAIMLKENAAVDELCRNAVLRRNENKCLDKILVRHFNFFSYFMPKLRAKIGVKLKYLNKNICAECKKCRSICPFGAINHNQKANSKCFRCGACVKNCEHDNKQFILRPVMRKYLRKYTDYSCSIEIY